MHHGVKWNRVRAGLAAARADRSEAGEDAAAHNDFGLHLEQLFINLPATSTPSRPSTVRSTASRPRHATPALN